MNVASRREPGANDVVLAAGWVRCPGRGRKRMGSGSTLRTFAGRGGAWYSLWVVRGFLQRRQPLSRTPAEAVPGLP